MVLRSLHVPSSWGSLCTELWDHWVKWNKNFYCYLEDFPIHQFLRHYKATELQHNFILISSNISLIFYKVKGYLSFSSTCYCSTSKQRSQPTKIISPTRSLLVITSHCISYPKAILPKSPISSMKWFIKPTQSLNQKIRQPWECHTALCLIDKSKNKK